jgi:D-sedoheptulose 7-phosphate isomerase
MSHSNRPKEINIRPEDLLSELQRKVNIVKELSQKSETFPVTAIFQLSERIVECFQRKGKVAFVGNGGSAAEASHLAAEFTGKCVVDHEPLPALSLNESISSLTAIANDFGVEEMYARQVKAHMRRGDILIALSTSGKSPNIIRAIEQASAQGVFSVLWTGNGNPETLASEVWRVPSNETPRIQEIHLAWGHMIAELVEVQFSKSY